MHSRCSGVSPFMFLLFSAAADVVVVVEVVGVDEEDDFFLALETPLETPLETASETPLETPSEADLAEVVGVDEESDFFLAASLFALFGVGTRFSATFGTFFGFLNDPLSSDCDEAYNTIFLTIMDSKNRNRKMYSKPQVCNNNIFATTM